MLAQVKNGNGREWSKAIPVQAVKSVINKLKDGTYPKEDNRCPCGASMDTFIVNHDRYTIPHRMVLCENCCLIRANPRMTKTAYDAFYNDEYRTIYDGFELGENSLDDQYLFARQAVRGTKLAQFMKMMFDYEPKSVIDIGCDKGGCLMPFHETGIPVHGVEICDRGRAYAESQGIPVVKTVDDLIKDGVKADMVVAFDIIEHLLDLNELCKYKDLLNPKGKLFLYTPGVLFTEPSGLFQNAHTYQFTAATLEYYMGKIGYEAEFLDERIFSVWKFTGKDLSDKDEPRRWRKYIGEHFTQPDKASVCPVRTHSKFKEPEMFANLRKNLKLGLQTIVDMRNKYSGEIVIVAGGPSVDGEIETVRNLVAEGKKLLVIDRMYEWCHRNELHPDFVVALDASDDVKDGFTHIQDGTKHFIVATTQPSVFDLVPKDSTYIWSGSAGLHPDAPEIWKESGYTKIPIVNTGGSVTLGSIYLALILGFKSIHLFGFDCMVTSPEKSYANDIAGESVERQYFKIEADGEMVLTCSSFLAFAQQFFQMMSLAKEANMLDEIKVYGDSLVNRMWDRDEESIEKKEIVGV